MALATWRGTPLCVVRTALVPAPAPPSSRGTASFVTKSSSSGVSTAAKATVMKQSRRSSSAPSLASSWASSRMRMRSVSLAASPGPPSRRGGVGGGLGPLPARRGEDGSPGAPETSGVRTRRTMPPSPELPAKPLKVRLPFHSAGPSASRLRTRSRTYSARLRARSLSWLAVITPAEPRPRPCTTDTAGAPSATLTQPSTQTAMGSARCLLTWRSAATIALVVVSAASRASFSNLAWRGTKAKPFLSRMANSSR
mmetsp:Transcript_12637/g.38009  ORF Transcript_12637/g.38009 Transcript_12637/m.38009 type:complete len:254 (-) Transcript_12637:92-853(-)